MPRDEWYYSYSYNIPEGKELVGKTIKEISTLDRDVILFTTTDGDEYAMLHKQDCCESVNLEDIAGDSLEDLIGSPILLFEEVTNRDIPGKSEGGYSPESYTWTFYKINTVKAGVTIRWYGESNGYYSESADLIKRRKGEE